MYHFMIREKNGELTVDEAPGETAKKAALVIIGMYPGCHILHTYDDNYREITPKEIFGDI